MNEIIFKVIAGKGGYYEAIPQHDKIGGGTVADDYNGLKEKVREFTRLVLKDGFHKEANLPENPQIKLVYSEPLFENPGAEQIFIAGSLENGVYRARTNTSLNLDLSHPNFDDLREQLLKEIRAQGHQDKQVEFGLEEVI